VNIGQFQPGTTLGTTKFAPVNRFFIAVNHHLFFVLQRQAFWAFVNLKPRFQIKPVVRSSQFFKGNVGFVMKQLPVLLKVILKWLRMHQKTMPQVKILLKSTVAATVMIRMSHNQSIALNIGKKKADNECFATEILFYGYCLAGVSGSPAQ
jgi:hypothetical protein